MTASCILGVDPGLSGALAFYFPTAADRIASEDLPIAGGNVDAANLAARIEQMRPDLAIVERVASRPGQGVVSVFKFGAAYGAVLGCLAACAVPVQLIAPTIWKRHFKLSADKEQSRALALRLFPACASQFSPIRQTRSEGPSTSQNRLRPLLSRHPVEGSQKWPDRVTARQ